MATKYTLPCSPSYVCEDRFSILDSDELQVPFWPLLEELLKQSITSPAQLIELLETIAVTLRQKSDTDYGCLRDFLHTKVTSDFFSRTWPLLVHLALQLPSLFPDSVLPILSNEHPSLRLSRKQAACLVVHQFLCTLAAPTWQDGYQDFHIWYSSEQPHAGAVNAYLTALFAYFDRLAGPRETSPMSYSEDEWPVTYTLTTDSTLPPHPSDYLIPFDLCILPEASTSPTLLGLPSGASVISANKFIGFGRTGTQEEVHVGCSPEVCPAVLITPPLRDEDVLIVRGAEAMISIDGYGRAARCGEVLPVPKVKEMDNHREMWKDRTMLFMDALELDLEVGDTGLPDLEEGNVQRELTKACTGFRHGQHSEKPFSVVMTGFWGCRTFGGNVSVKTMIQWCAASKAGCEKMRFICSGEEQELFGRQMMKFVEALTDGKIRTADLERALLELNVEDVGPNEDALDVVSAKLKLLPRERHS
jgi:poly(ADP-ribose) glycohydrolase